MMRLDSWRNIILSPSSLTLFGISLFVKPELEFFLFLVGWDVGLPTVCVADVWTLTGWAIMGDSHVLALLTIHCTL